MKKIILKLVVVFLMLTKSFFSYGNEYIPLLKQGNQWNELVQNFSVHPDGHFQITHITKIGNDTIINGIRYYELLTARDEFSSIWTSNGYIRECIVSRSVYYKPIANESEILLYDFSLQVGDEVLSYDFIFPTRRHNVLIRVEAIDYVLIGEKLRKRMNVRVTDLSRDFFRNHVWIEGIGNMDGFLRSTFGTPIAGGGPISLLCFFQNDELIYKNDNVWIYNPEDIDIFEDCFAWWIRGSQSNTHDIKNSNIKIYPNPVADILTVSCSNNAISRIEIFDNLGRKVYSQAYKNTINVGHFSKGLYFLKVYDTNEQVSVFKFIKK